eukprot:c11167_g1_i1 orf=188-2356(+)
MLRFASNRRLLSVCWCLHLSHSEIRPSKILCTELCVAIEACGFASSAFCDSGKNMRRRPLPSRTFSRLPMVSFFKRTEGTNKILQLFDTMAVWDDAQTPLVLFGLGVPFNSYIVSEVIRRCAHVDIALRFFKWLKNRGDFNPDTHVYNALIYRLGKVGNLKEMDAIGSLAIREGKATVVNFNTLIAGFRLAKDIDGATRTWRNMRELGFKPCTATYTVMIDLYASMKMYNEAGEFYFQMLKANIRPSIRTCTTLIQHLVDAGKLDAAMDIFDNLLKVKLRPNRVTYACIMMGHAKVGDMNAVCKLIGELKDFGHSPRKLGESFTLVLKYLVNEGRLEDAEVAMEAGWPDASIEEIKEKIAEFQGESAGNASCGANMHCASMLTDEMDCTSNDDESGKEDDGNVYDMDVLSHDTTSTLNVPAFAKCLVLWSSSTVKALDSANVKWDCYLVSDVLNRLRKADSGWKFYQWVATQPGYHHDRYTCGKMIRLLLKSGQFVRVKELLLEAQQDGLDLSLRTYSSILKHCGLWKDANFAIEVFDMLKASSLMPDELCYKYFIHSLHRCERDWRVAYVCAEMQKAGFLLDETMYSFLITGFVRAGKQSIARRLSKQMRVAGFKPNAAMFNALIKAFVEHGRLDKAERVFKGMRQRGMMPMPEVCRMMTEVLSDLGKVEEAQELKVEIKALISQSKKAKKVRRKWFLHFHSCFINSFTDNTNVQAMTALG